MADLDKMARELLANCLDDFGHPQEARNVRDGEDLESYEVELRLIRKLHTNGCLRLTSEPLTAPPGWKLVPVDPTPEMVKAAEEAYMPFGDMELAIQMAIAATPREVKDGA